jgi:tetratricopeptide (TPR) repeat protein
VLERLPEQRISQFERRVEVLVLRDERSMRAVAPEFWEQRTRSRPAGLFVRGADSLRVALQLDRLGVSLRRDATRDFSTDAAEAGYIANPYHVVFHEYVHALLQNDDKLPLWLSEGIAEFYASSIIESERVVLGKPNVDNIHYLRDSRLLPLDRLLQVTRESPEYRDASLTPLFYAQSWALFHMLQVGEKGDNRERLVAYQAAVEAGADSVNAARQAFGDLAAFEESLFRYIRRRVFDHEVRPGSTRVDGRGWTMRSITAPEAALAQARFLAQTRRPAEAQAMLAEAAAGGSESAGIHEVRALLHRQAGRSDEAHASYQRALELGSTSALTHFEVARTALGDEADAQRLGEAQRLVERALTLDSAFAPAYALLGEILLARDVEPARALDMAMRAIELMPADVYGYVVASRAALRLERLGEAVDWATRALAACDSDDERARVSPVLSEARRRAAR